MYSGRCNSLIDGILQIWPRLVSANTCGDFFGESEEFLELEIVIWVGRIPGGSASLSTGCIAGYRQPPINPTANATKSQ